MSHQPAEFSLESVRQLMLANGGRITNHQLVKSFKRWLTDPQEKENARAQFKDYVNTLATIKQENGEKYLILKKKFYPEYNSSCGYSSSGQYESYPVTSHAYRHTSYDPPQPSGSNFSRQNSYSSAPLSSHPGAGPALLNGHNSPSLLDEVMAGWAPPSRSMAAPGRQLPVIPQQNINSLGLPAVGHNSVGLPSPLTHMPDSHLAQRNSQTSLISGQSYSHLPDQRNSVASLGSGQSYSHLPDQRSSGQSYSHLADQRNSVASIGSGQSYSHLQDQRSSVTSLGSGQSYSHLQNQRSSVASLGSGQSYSHLPDQRNSVTSLGSVPGQSYPHLTEQRNSLASSSGNSYHGSPRQSYAGYSHLHTAHPAPVPRPPPPYRAPPSDPVLPPSSSSPPPPPRRNIPSDSQQPPPPPLPRRQLPSTNNLQPLDVGLPVSQSRGPVGPQQVPAKPHKLIESQQPSPTDSGFTEDPSKFSEYPLPRNSSLSKSIGNLSLENSEKTNKIEGSVSLDNLDAVPSKEDEKAVSVRERTKTFNRMASETELPAVPAALPGSGSLAKLPPAVKRRNSRAVEMMGGRRISNKSDHDDTADSSSITTIDPTIKQWMVHTSKGDYQVVAKMLMENPKLSRHRDFTSGYTGLHWACKHGNLDMVKLLAGTYQASVDVKSHGGYTPLHIAAQYNHQEVFDLLVQVRPGLCTNVSVVRPVMGVGLEEVIVL